MPDHPLRYDRTGVEEILFQNLRRTANTAAPMDIPMESCYSLGNVREDRDLAKELGGDPALTAMRSAVFVRALRNFCSRLRRTVRDGPRDREFLAEIQQHVDLLTERYRGQGMTAKEAEMAARRQFGNAAGLIA